MLIIVGALLALAGEELRDSRGRRARASAAMASIRDELVENQRLVRAAETHHRFLSDTLAKLVANQAHPDVAIYSNGMWNPAIVTNTAWQAARETGALADMPMATVLHLAPAYEAQDRYRTLAEAMVTAIMGDVRRDGMDMVLRERFAQFIPLDVDFANREARLLDVYAKALGQLSEPR